MSNYRTPWSASASGTLTSDRLKPKVTKQAGNSASKGNKKGKDAAPKSPRVRELEGILNRLKESEGKAKDPEGGCFCQARSHALSPYVPICTFCGLILCELNPPSSCCPFSSCGVPLLSPAARSSLITRVEVEIEETIRHEIEEEERKREQLKAQEGSFPLLGIPNSSAHQAQRQQPQTYKVLSLNPKTKKATIASYSPRSSTPATPSPSSSVEVLPQGPPRVPPPMPPQVAPQPDPRRPFMDLRNDTAIGATYVARQASLKRVDVVDTSQSEGSDRRRGVGGRVVPGAG
ncbi:hypothetical protein SCHPADRAFT_900119 [Schizopora paradoxa]|uniref:TRIP4/RQT4 C2HC5-type zinc finger domain-containing protein n=1 Tax=Schizopora paradoxa TaxID=27342 RepID=A0A0H2S1S7_9AGAM|nr:hypothetical protein SCHPADRAFT_900119 [Schizopora paradoxa]